MLQFELETKDGYMLARLAGLVSPEAWQKMVAELARALEGAPHDRLVANLDGLVGWLGEPERRAVGTLMAAGLSRMKKVALVIEARKITGVVEEEAQKAGLDLRLYSDFGEAARWAVA